MISGVGDRFAIPRNRIGPIALTLAVWAWFAFLSFPLMGEAEDIEDFSAEFVHSGSSLAWQILGLALFVTAVSTAYPARLLSTLPRLGSSQIAILAVFALSLALQLHDEERFIVTGIVYTCIFLVTALSMPVVWTMAPADLERCMIGAAVLLCSFGVTALAVFGIPTGRDVGGIQANLFAGPLLAGFIFSLFYGGYAGVVIRILCFAMIALVSARFAVIGCTVAIVLFQLTYEPLRRENIAVLIVAVIGGIVFWPQVVQIMALDDPTRGLGSGASGRGELWYDALTTIANNSLGIGFKRTLGNESGHNGYLKTLLEFGVAGGGLIIFSLACHIFMAGVDAIMSSQQSRQQHRFASARFSGLTALSFGAFFQPQLFNLGDVFGVALLLLLFKPQLYRGSHVEQREVRRLA